MKRLILPILVAVTALALTACTEAEPQQPVVTQDNIEPTTTADEVVEAVQSELDFNHYWLGDLDDATFVTFFERTMGTAPTEEDYDSFYEEAAKQKAINPIITPQEAANIAGEILVSMYGAEKDVLDQQMFMHVDEDYWVVYQVDFSSDIAYQVLIDHTTGSIIYCYYNVIAQEYTDRMQSTPIDPSYTPSQDAPMLAADGHWDVESEGYTTTIDRLKLELKSELEGSILLQNVAITAIEVYQQQHEINAGLLSFVITLDDGRELSAARSIQAIPYTSFDHDGYPLRAYTIGFDNYLTGE